MSNETESRRAPSVTEISISTEGTIRALGRIRVPIEEAMAMGDWKTELSGLVKETAQLRQTYIASISDDGRLIGDERLRLVDELDDVLGHLILIRAVIAGDAIYSASDSNMRYSHHLNIRIEKTRWEGDGALGRFRKINLSKFGDWLSNIYSRMQELVQFMAKAAADGVIDDAEKNGINRLLDRMIFSVIIVREHVERGDID